MHAHDAKICLQLLHAGRYAYHPLSVSASKLKAPINPFTPRALVARAASSARSTPSPPRAKLARDAGYDGVEIMGSEGYLINQFTAARTNQRNDAGAATPDNRMRFAVEIVRRVREACGPDFILIYRLSMLDLVDGGNDWDEIVAQAKAVEAAGATIINTGIGWHEARMPTIATSVPRAAFAGVTAKLRPHVRVAAGRHQPHQHARRRRTHPRRRRRRHGVDGAPAARRSAMGEQGARRHARDAINTCIACNQACLDHVFAEQAAPAAWSIRAPAPRPNSTTRRRLRRRRIAVVGAGPAGLACATDRRRARPPRDPVRCRRRDRRPVQPGQADPGKEEFHETLRYFRHRIEETGVELRLSTRADAGPAARRSTRWCSPPA